MIELFLFINPIGPICYDIEKEILNKLNTSRKKIHLQILPFVNLFSVGVSMDYLSMNKTDLVLRNEQTNQIYAASLDYKAAQLQGKKIARDFLLKLQQRIGIERQEYSDALVKELFSETNGDLEMFLEDRSSELVKKNFATDQRVAKDMGITITPSAVVYDFSSEEEYGVLLEGSEELRSLPLVCGTVTELDTFLQKAQSLKAPKLSTIHEIDRGLILL